MSSITTQALDTARGRPADGVPLALARAAREGRERAGHGETDADGRMLVVAGHVVAHAGTVGR